MSDRESIAYHQRVAAARDAQRAAYLANMAANPTKFDNAGLRDISQLSVRAASEIARLRGPQGRD